MIRTTPKITKVNLRYIFVTTNNEENINEKIIIAIAMILARRGIVLLVSQFDITGPVYLLVSNQA